MLVVLKLPCLLAAKILWLEYYLKCIALYDSSFNFEKKKKKKKKNSWTHLE